MEVASTQRKKPIQYFINLFPKGLRLKLNPDRYCIERFIEKISKKMKPKSKLLDAGAGPCPYKKFFKHTKYEATDFQDNYGVLDFTCSLRKIPRKSSYYDAIICTEVLEHVEFPQDVINEFYRILKKKGRLYLTVPQGRTLHQEPYNYFYFTRYGLLSLLKNADFKDINIIPKGGYFWFLSDAVRFNGIAGQYKEKSKLLYYLLKILEYPFTNILIPLLLFPLDSLDKEKKWTCGYLVEAEK